MSSPLRQRPSSSRPVSIAEPHDVRVRLQHVEAELAGEAHEVVLAQVVEVPGDSYEKVRPWVGACLDQVVASHEHRGADHQVPLLEGRVLGRPGDDWGAVSECNVLLGAVRKGVRTEAAQLLLQRGATADGASGTVALRAAKSDGVKALLREHGATLTLPEECRAGNMAAISTLLDGGADVESDVGGDAVVPAGSTWRRSTQHNGNGRCVAFFCHSGLLRPTIRTPMPYVRPEPTNNHRSAAPSLSQCCASSAL